MQHKYAYNIILTIFFVAITSNLVICCSENVLNNRSPRSTDTGPGSVPIEISNSENIIPNNDDNNLNQLANDKNETNNQIYLESLEDLEHVAFLSLRNFNLTDENLKLPNPTHRREQDDEEPSDGNNNLDDGRHRLAGMLESFIYHLRKDHLKRSELEELQALAGDFEPNNQSDTIRNTSQNPTSASQERCQYLVRIYQKELELREQTYLIMSSSSSGSGAIPRTDTSTSNATSNGKSISACVETGAQNFKAPSTSRLLQLCRLVVDCQSAEDFASIISGPWFEALNSSPSSEPLMAEDNLERDSSDISSVLAGQREARTIRESVSKSLAKLCPLILFQLHDSEGHCTANRDDRPPMIAVWAFATLFVTIVSFCSLIGLSITPLLGTTATSDDSSVLDELGSNSSSSSSDSSRISATMRQFTMNKSKLGDGDQGRACLTLFEGLAVGSLVGSALFSLIPQAFELQDRESNQGFLFKALIIFFGIYLFFCSERIMRIILDNRNKRNRFNDPNHRPSTSNAPHQNSMESALNYGLAIDSNQGLGSQMANYESQSVLRRNSATRDRLKLRTGSRSRGHSDLVSQQSISTKSHAHGYRNSDKRSSNRYRGSNLRNKKNSRNQSFSNPEQQSHRDDRKPASSKSKTRRRRQRIKEVSWSDNEVGINEKVKSKYSSSERELSITDTDSNDYHVKEFKSEMNQDQRNVMRLRTKSARNRRKNSPHIRLQTPELKSFHDKNINQGFMNARKTNDWEQDQDISTVAWMIVIGDGLHNFIDGISIGAAFSESILSGVSISVAVICEEFPHELGDFAVLVSSGMTVRQALGYNFLSACTCYLGMAFGIILGDVDEGASYISSLAAGVFLYIALVDMMGELSATLERSSHCSLAKTLNLLLLQNVGIFIGISIIFILSFIDF